MSDRFEASLETYLAGIFEQRLHQVLKGAGFRETLRLAEPHVTEFQRDSDLLTVRTGRAGPHQRLVVIESESVDVNPVAGLATREVIVEVAGELLRSLPWVDRSAVLGRIESCLADLPGGSA